MEAIKGLGPKLANAVSGLFGTTAPVVAAKTEQAIGPLPSGPAIGTAPEPAGMTTAGGRRLSKMKKGKTRKASKKSRKTRKH